MRRCACGLLYMELAFLEWRMAGACSVAHYSPKLREAYALRVETDRRLKPVTEQPPLF